MLRNALAGLCALPLAAASQASSATLTNLDAEPFVVIVTERGASKELRVRNGQTVAFCLRGCFVILPNGDRAALAGNEDIEISGGRIAAKQDLVRRKLWPPMEPGAKVLSGRAELAASKRGAERREPPQ
jgi:hypothetical protein